MSSQVGLGYNLGGGGKGWFGASDTWASVQLSWHSGNVPPTRCQTNQYIGPPQCQYKPIQYKPIHLTTTMTIQTNPNHTSDHHNDNSGSTSKCSWNGTLFTFGNDLVHLRCEHI